MAKEDTDARQKDRQRALDILETTRVAARRAYIALFLSGMSVALLLLVIYMLWRVLEHLPKV